MVNPVALVTSNPQYEATTRRRLTRATTAWQLQILFLNFVMGQEGTSMYIAISASRP
jgi:hypothetical protein